MNTAMKVQSILMTIGCLLIETSAYNNWECRKLDFNKANSISAIEKCTGFNEFVIKSFEDNSSVMPYSHNSVYYLSNDKEGWSCFSTTDLFTLEEDTEFSSAIYLQSDVIEDMSEVEIEVVDLDNGTTISVVNASTSRDFEWKFYRMKFGKPITNARISVRALVTTSANLAIQYMNILNPKIDESLCDVDDQTTTETTTEQQTTIKEETTVEVETSTETRSDSCTSSCTCACSCPLDI